MEALDGASERIAGDADGSMTFFICFKILLFNTLWMQFVDQQGLMQILRGSGPFPIFILNTLWWLVVFMTVIMEMIDGSSERIARDANRSITNFICFNL